MSIRRVVGVVGLLLVFVAGAMFATAIVAAAYGDGDHRAFGWAGAITLTVGWLGWVTNRIEGDITIREGFAIVTLAWSATAFFGALPYLLSGVTRSVAAALFESMSGFTTTGSSVFADIEALPHGILFWRSLSHWLGGMGIIVLVVAVLPYLGVGGMQLFKAEVPGPTPERLRPRIAQTAKLLWMVYFGMTAAYLGALLLGGVRPFDAVNHAFSTTSTGGFSTRSDSMATFSPYVQWVTIAFMYLAGVNFALHFRAATGRIEYFRSHEWRFFTGVLAASTLSIVAVHLLAADNAEVLRVVRESLFQVVAIATTTGFVVPDYALWAPGGQLILFTLFFLGGMAGSTSGGVKAVRVLLLLRETAKEVRRHLHPKAVFVTRIGGRVVKSEVVERVVGFVMLYLLLCLLGAVGLSLSGIDPLSAITGSIASVGNIGPAFGDFGPTDHYGWAPEPALFVMTFLMLVGRLELFTVLVLFHPDLWTRARRGR